MTTFFQWLANFFGSWKVWIVIPAWEVGGRIRLGKNPTRLNPGFHFRVPLLDEITLINTRLRLATCPPVTVSSKNGGHINRVITANAAYRIVDPIKALLAYSTPSNAIMMLLQSTIVRQLPEPEALAILKGEVGKNGIEIERISYVEDVEVRTLRILQNAWQLSDDGAQIAGHVPQARW